MGQAKQRGSLQDRIDGAKARIDALRPAFITCNSCQHDIADVVDLNSRGLDGIEAAFAGLCPKCGRSTYAIKGRPEAVAELMVAMEETMGETPLLGSQ